MYIGTRYTACRYIEARHKTGHRENMARKQRTAVTPKSQLPLAPATFQILLALVGGERHGYAIMQEVTASTRGAVRLGPGTLYGALKRLLEAGLVEEDGDRPDPELGDDRRRYYRLTKLGLRVARLEARRLEAMVHAARQKKLIGMPA
jgi:DNA-binding PadR family transcriptional regulator